MHEPAWTQKDTDGFIERQKQMCRNAIENYNNGRSPVLSAYADVEMYYWIEKISRTTGLLKKRETQDIVLAEDSWSIMQHSTLRFSTRYDLTICGYEEIAASIDGVARLARLLARPENHIKVRSGQFVEKEVPSRTEIDMVNEVVRKLTGLWKYTAYVKILHLTGKIRTLELAEVTGEKPETSTALYVRRREVIEEEIRLRQESWKPAECDEVSSVRSRGGRQPARPDGKGVVRVEDEPPPQEA